MSSFSQGKFEAYCSWYLQELYQDLIISKLDDNLNILSSSWITAILLVFKMPENVPDESDRLKKEASWLDVCLFKNLRILVGILFSSAASWTEKEEMMSFELVSLKK